MTEPETVTVMCVDDREFGETFDRVFDEDRRRRCEFDGDEPRRLERFGGVLASGRAARAMLVRSLNEGIVPDIVLIDHMLRGSREKYEEGGLELMCAIRDEFHRREQPLPACIVCTTRFTPGLAYAYALCGAAHAIDGVVDWPDRVAGIWEGYDRCVAGGPGWTHRAKPGFATLKAAPTSVELLPYLEADVPVPEIAAALGIKQDTVHDRRRALVHAMNEHIPHNQLPDGKPVVVNGRSTSLASIASDHGLVWLPLAYAEYVKSPENRAQRPGNQST